jgi:hypothetical protein
VEVARGLVCATPMAFVDWPAAVAALGAGRLACSGSEGQMLLVAASLAEGIPVDLREAVCGLDQTNLALVAGAVLHAGGRRAAVVALSGVEGR